MKKLLLVLILVSSVIISCSKEDQTDSYSDQIQMGTGMLNTKCFDNDFYSVSESDMEAYVEFAKIISEEQSVVKAVQPIDYKGVCVAYIVDYGGRWELIASDKRIPRILASGEGSFAKDLQNEHFASWLEGLYSAVVSFKSYDILNEKLQRNVEFWQMITLDNTFMSKLCPQTKSFVDHGIPHITQVDTILTCISIPHLIETQWGQASPYNRYCPLKSFSNTDRVPAGCVAVAGAQMAYFIKTNIGLAQEAPDMAVCYGHVEPQDTIDFYNATYGTYPRNFYMNQWVDENDGWDRIGMGDSSVIAVLIAQMGSLVEMEYGDNESASGIEYLPDALNDAYGISTAYALYNENLIYSRLQAGLPTIVRGADEHDNNGHAFIIDRYRFEQTEYRIVITISYSDGTESKRIDYIYSDPFNYSFGMNWGWAGLCDDTWFPFTGDWIALGDQYNYCRFMVALTENYLDNTNN
ncbi:MAG: C10 family peptidase [Bacteroidales bacterium]|nr:C10 family peptidase [Bacteroidales bacterium]